MIWMFSLSERSLKKSAAFLFDKTARNAFRKNFPIIARYVRAHTAISIALAVSSREQVCDGQSACLRRRPVSSNSVWLMGE